MRRVTILTVIAVLVAGCGADPSEETLSGFERSPTPTVNGASLPAASGGGEPFNFEAATDDGLLLVYFGYTNCPDVCPTTLFDLRAALDSLPSSQSGRIGTAMITIDPERDTDDVLTRYVRSFLPDAAALRTSVDPDLRLVADAFGADYGVTTATDGTVEVVHTGSLYAVNGSGELLVTWPFGVRSGDIARDLDILLHRVAA